MHPYRAIYSIQGMSCASCANMVRQAAAECPEVEELKVDPLTGRAVALVPSEQVANFLAGKISDSGYETSLEELLPIQAGPVYEVRATIEGMTCSACANTIREAVKHLDFVERANIDPLNGTGTFLLRNKQSESVLKETIENTGYDYELVSLEEKKNTQETTKTRTITLEIIGMYCERCPDNVLAVLKSYGDAVEIEKNPTLTRPTLRFTYVPSPPEFGIRAIIDEIRIQAPGLDCSAVQPKSPEQITAENRQKEKKDILKRLKVTAVLAIPALVLMFKPMVMMSYRGKLLLMLLATPVYFWSALLFHKHALNKNYRSPFHFGSMNLLMSLGTSISYWCSLVLLVVDPAADSYFDSVIFLTLFLLGGRYLDVYSKAKTTTAVSSLQSLRPDSVLVKQDSTWESVQLWQVDVGDLVKVQAGSKAGIDGSVVSGTSQFDEATLTGESRPAHKSSGDLVYSGTINVGTEAVVLKVAAVDQGTLLDGIVEAVRQGQIVRAKIETAADQLTAVFVPIVIYLALFVWVVWYALGKLGYVDAGFLDAMEFAVAVFVVACPCGVGLAAPTALYVGGGMAAKNGIIARGGGEAFEQGAAVDAVCFDKTGTLTTSNAEITDTWYGQIVDLVDKNELIQLAARIEDDSTHPLASAVKKFASGAVMTSRVDGVKLIPGKGLRASIVKGPFENKTAYLGNSRLADDLNIQLPKELQDILFKWKHEGKSIMILFVDGQAQLAMAAQDKIRDEAPATVQALQQMGIQCWLISGDNAQTARVVASQVGISAEHVIAEVLPQEKADRIKWLQDTAAPNRKAVVAMVGDGVNDAPAIALSDVGIAVGGGADITLNTAKFILVNSNLKGVATTLDLSKAVMHKVRLNFAWAALYNLLAVPFAAGIFTHWGLRLDPVFASLAMCLSSLSVMANSLMLRRYKYK